MPDIIRFFQTLIREFPGLAMPALLLGGSPMPGPLNRWVVIGLGARQSLRLRGDSLEENGQARPVPHAGWLFERLEVARQRARCWKRQRERHDLPMAGGLAGVIGYGFARWCDAGAPQASSGLPDLILHEAEDWLLIRMADGALSVLSDSPERSRHYQALWAAAPEPPVPLSPLPPSDTAYLAGFEASFTPARFEAAVIGLQRQIAAGEIYQANLSIRFDKELALDPLALYGAMHCANPSPFGGVLLDPDCTVVSNSPERLLGSDGDGRLFMRPIAGTRGRGRTPEEDAAIGQSLLENEKERAEHLMLVDLARNDLGRVCLPGSVAVDELLTLERYSHVTHLVSNVCGRLRPEQTPWQALAAAFPGGTITGCPKLRCMELLHATEPVPRGFYTGSMGYMDAASPAMDWNILIRSVFLEPLASLRYNAAWHVGAGIVHDSVPAHEYRECLRKAQAVLSALQQAERTAASNI